MEIENLQESRLSKGIIGVAALALLGGAGGTIAYTMFGPGIETRTSDPEPDNTIDVADAARGSDIIRDPVNDTVDGPDRMPARTDTTTQDPPETAPEEPAPKPPRAPLPNMLKEAAFIVRFNSSDELDKCLKMYRQDKDASREAFAKWAAGHPELDGLSLQRVNYSGEVILRYDGAEDENPVATAKQLAERLRGFEAVRYADPDYTAFPGKGD